MLKRRSILRTNTFFMLEKRLGLSRGDNEEFIDLIFSRIFSKIIVIFMIFSFGNLYV